MKSKLARIWGVGLVLVLMVGLLAWSAPVAADTLEWDDEDIPDTDDFILLANENIVTMDVAEDGLVIFAGTGDGNLYVTTDKGLTWDDSAAPAGEGVDVDLVAVSPDDPQYIAIADSATTEVIISDDAGATFDSLGLVSATLGSLVNILDVAVSRESDDNRWIAVAGSDGTDILIAYYEIGAIGAAWTDITTIGGFSGGDNTSAALAFSPNFHSDEIMVAVTGNNSANTIDFNMFSFNQERWNDSAGFSDYPADVNVEADAFGSLDAVDVALSPDYLGSDDDLRVAFVATATNTETEEAGLFRLEDDDVDALENETNMNSVAFDGSLLVAGGYGDTEVYYSEDPLASDPDVDDTASMKAPGGVDQVLVGVAGDLVVAATQGDGSCFSISRNNGSSFQDISLIDTSLTDTGDVLTDIAVSSDGAMQYLASWDNSTSDLSVWRMGGEGQEADWERVFFDDSTSAANDYIIRTAPDDPDVIFLAEPGDTTIYYSTDAGEGRWRTRSSRYDIFDMAVETTGEVLYVLEDASACYVSKSTNTGFTWGGEETTGLTDGPSTIVSLGEDMLLVGSDDGTVSMSSDGNESWTDLEDSMDAGGDVQVTATGLSSGDFIFAATSGGTEIYRWEIGEDDSWDDIVDLSDDPPSGTDYSGYDFGGIALMEDVLYAIGENGTNSVLIRVLDPTDGVDVSEAVAASAEFSTAPSALRASIGSVNLWTIDQDNDAIYNYEDTIGTVGPTLKAPGNGSTIPINEISGDTADVNFTWEAQSDEVEDFDMEIAEDADFDAIVVDTTIDFDDAFDEGDIANVLSTDTAIGVEFMPGITYYWRVRVNDEGPVLSPWSETFSFTVSEAKAPPPVEVQPAAPAPEITLEPTPPPEVTLPAPVVNVPEVAPAIPTGLLWAVVVIGAILVIAVLVLIVRTRKIT